MTERIIIAGAGGQGIMLLGKVLAESAMRENKYVTWLPSYGAEVRGGAAYCMVVVSSEEIGSPYINTADTLIAMNALSLERFKSRLKRSGLLLVNSSLVEKTATPKTALRYPFTDTAMGLGNIRVANIVALGSCLARKKIVSRRTVKAVIAQIAPPDKKNLIEINQRALSKGIELVEESLL